MERVNSIAAQAGAVPRLDWLLRFDPLTNAAYEADNGQTRAVYLSRIVILGLILYNCYNASSVFLMPDILWESMFIRSVLFSVPTFGLAYLVLKVDAIWRERLVLNGMIGAFAVPVVLFWWTKAPLGNFAFTELDLTLVFGALVLQLRFRHNLVFAGFALPAMLLAIWTKPKLPDGLAWAFTLQSVTVCIFVVLCNYLSERRRCEQYLAVLTAQTRAVAAEQETVEVERLALTDILTGLPNRRALDQFLNEQFAQETDIAILMCDFDHFKLLNDTLGHAEGDTCLRDMGAVLSELADQREVFAARYGGEEFAVVATGLSPLEVTRIADDLLRRIQRVGFAHPSRPDGLGIVTLSIGASLRPATDQMRIGDLVQEADAALYAAKAKGRNQCVLSDALKQRVLQQVISL